MEVDAVRAEVQSVLQDSAFTDDWIIGKFNKILLLIATVTRIPALQLTKPLTAAVGTSSLVLPLTYLHDLYLVTSEVYPKGLPLYHNYRSFLSAQGDYATDDGQIEMVHLSGKVLSYYRSPEVAEVLTCSYYSKPVTLEAGDDFPDYIPETLQETIFQSFALKEAYLKIEDGTDGKAVNTEKYNGIAGSGVQTLIQMHPNAPKARPEIIRVKTFF